MHLRVAISLVFFGLILTLTGCSVLDPYNSSRPKARTLPKIPEIKRQVVRPRVVPQRKVPTRPRVNNKRVIKSKQQQQATRKILNEEEKQRVTVDIDPYASIPENSSDQPEVVTTKRVGLRSSPAVKSLMIGARADIAIGRTSAAVSKLERGLRIESQNPGLWHLLAKAHYAQSDYQQTISMAKKSNRYSGDDALISQNWQLIKKAGEKSGDMTAVKEAIHYSKVNR